MKTEDSKDLQENSIVEFDHNNDQKIGNEPK